MTPTYLRSKGSPVLKWPIWGSFDSLKLYFVYTVRESQQKVSNLTRSVSLLEISLQGLLGTVLFFIFSKIRLMGENICRTNSLDSEILGLKFGRVHQVCWSFYSQNSSPFFFVSIFCVLCHEEENHWFNQIFLLSCHMSGEHDLLIRGVCHKSTQSARALYHLNFCCFCLYNKDLYLLKLTLRVKFLHLVRAASFSLSCGTLLMALVKL